MNLSYLVSEVSSQIVVLPAEVVVIQLSQTGPEHMLTTEERMVGKDQSRNIDIELEVPLKFSSTGYIQTGTGGLKGLGGRKKDPPCARNASNYPWKCGCVLNISTSFTNHIDQLCLSV